MLTDRPLPGSRPTGYDRGMGRKRGGERPTRNEKRSIGDRSQKLAQELMSLNDAALASVPLEDHVRDAVEAARKVTSNIARRREQRRLGGVLRDYDLDAIDEALAAERDASADEAKAFKRSERWRADLLEDDDALDRFVAQTAVDRAELAGLIDDARHERSTGAPRGAQRTLFRAVRDALGG